MLPSTIKLVEKLLRRQWSPEQIAGWLKKQCGSKTVSHQTIYQHIWWDKKNGGELYRELRHRGKKYNKKGKATSGRGHIPNRVDIDERPKEVEEKLRLGDWELDTIIGKAHSGAIVSMVERRTKLTKLALVPNKTATGVKEAIIKKLIPLKNFVLTLTADNGKEFAQHVEVREKLDAGFYFAKPYQSWQRGLNEHTNGLVRQYYPKSKLFNEISEEDLMKVEEILNKRPRKVLNYATPLEVFQ